MSETSTSEAAISADFSLEPLDNQRLANLCGPLNVHIQQLEQRFEVAINQRANRFRITGVPHNVDQAGRVLEKLYADTRGAMLNAEAVHLASAEAVATAEKSEVQIVSVRTRRVTIQGRGYNQRRYLDSIKNNDINFGVGPAGTGKTYLAVACAVEALENERVERLILTRPAVEAGERLGFLPGDLSQKVDPYLRPLYDALYEMLGFERVAKLIERNVIEIAPLAYMRGRTLNEAFIILDEAQNTTTEQMKMFLTRIGFGSTAVITGDITQVDLPRNVKSGLRHVVDVLKDVDGISFTFLTHKDVVRHPLVGRIIQAYEKAERETSTDDD
ncbi:MAG: PhoH family protein [Pseudomonadota bacterium]